jgi:hypothetical protein
MNTSREREQAAQELLNAEANAVEQHKSEAIKSLKEFSTVADRLPDDFIVGELHNSYDFDPNFKQAWDNRESDPEMLKSSLERMARNIDSLAERIHADTNDEDTTGAFPDDLKGVVRDLRGAAQLGSRIPNRLVENWLQSQAKRDPAVYEAIASRESDPFQYEDFVRRAAHHVNAAGIAAETGTRPSPKLRHSPEEMMAMSPSEFDKAVREYRRDQAAGKKGRKR